MAVCQLARSTQAPLGSRARQSKLMSGGSSPAGLCPGAVATGAPPLGCMDPDEVRIAACQEDHSGQHAMWKSAGKLLPLPSWVFKPECPGRGPTWKGLLDAPGGGCSTGAAAAPPTAPPAEGPAAALAPPDAAGAPPPLPPLSVTWYSSTVAVSVSNASSA